MSISETRSRKWMITINNYQDFGIDYEQIKAIMPTFKSLKYYCMSKEIGLLNSTPHIHIFVYFDNAVRFTTLKNRLGNNINLKICDSTCEKNRDYVFKEGKHAGTEKEETNLKDTHFEYGEMPVERQGARNDLADLYDMVVDGASDLDIIRSNYNNILRMSYVEKLRKKLKAEKFNNCLRNVETIYLYGETGIGKTKYIYDNFEFSEIFRITDYKNPFDKYSFQDVLVFDEFKGQIPITYLNMLLDYYPVELGARYENVPACYTKVYILSNFPPEKLYLTESAILRRAFQRRLKQVFEVTPYGLAECPNFFTNNN